MPAIAEPLEQMENDLRPKIAYTGGLTEHFGNMQKVLQIIDCAPF